MARLGLGAAVMSVIFQSVGPIFVRKSGFPGLAFAFHRLWMATLVYLAISAVRGRLPRWEVLRISAPGGVLFAANVSLFFVAIGHTTIANATVIGALQPVALMVVAALFFGERLGRIELAMGALAIAGVAIAVLAADRVGSGDRMGDLYATGAMLTYAGYYIASKRARATLDTLDYQTSLTLVAVVVMSVAIAISGQSLDAPRPSAWWWAVGMVALPGSGHLLTNFAHPHIKLGVLGMLTLFTPVGSAVMAWIFFDEALTALQVVGIVMVIGALSTIVLHTNHRTQRIVAATNVRTHVRTSEPNSQPAD